MLMRLKGILEWKNLTQGGRGGVNGIYYDTAKESGARWKVNKRAHVGRG